MSVEITFQIEAWRKLCSHWNTSPHDLARGLRAACDALEASQARQGGPSIPWELAENIYKAYSALFGTDQSLERLNERGGFGWGEVTAIGFEYRKRFGCEPEGWSYCSRGKP